MDPVSQSSESLQSVRRHRAELREAIGALEEALAAPTPGRAEAWAQRVRVALVELAADLREHVAVTEGPGGLHRDVLATAPRLSNAVARLTREHGQMQALVDDLLARLADPPRTDGTADVRDRGTALLGMLVRHRQVGADLVYEAYQSDLGGET